MFVILYLLVLRLNSCCRLTNFIHRTMYHILVTVHAINLKIQLFSTSMLKMLPLCLKIEQQLPSLRLKVLNILCFIQNKVLPLFTPKTLMILDDQFVRCNAYMECIWFGPTWENNTAIYHRNCYVHNYQAHLWRCFSLEEQTVWGKKRPACSMRWSTI
jgi:hypothetical protein